MKAIETLKEMKGKAFMYDNAEVVILSYADFVGEDADDVEIYLNNGQTLVYKMSDLAQKLNRFKPITKTVVAYAQAQMSKVTTFDPDTLNTLRATILQQIAAVKESKDNIPQAKTIFYGVGAFTDLCKTEINARLAIEKLNRDKTIWQFPKQGRIAPMGDRPARKKGVRFPLSEQKNSPKSG